MHLLHLLTCACVVEISYDRLALSMGQQHRPCFLTMARSGPFCCASGRGTYIKVVVLYGRHGITYVHPFAAERECDAYACAWYCAKATVGEYRPDASAPHSATTTRQSGPIYVNSPPRVSSIFYCSCTIYVLGMGRLQPKES